jgi:ABC-type uncharacterized transport system ATPase subunit
VRWWVSPGCRATDRKNCLCALSGEDVRAAPGSVRWAALTCRACIRAARKLGLHFVPEERLGRGAVPTLSLAHNLLLTRQEAIAWPRFAGGWIRVRQLEAQAADIIAGFNVKAGGPRLDGALAVGWQPAKVHCWP